MINQLALSRERKGQWGQNLHSSIVFGMIHLGIGPFVPLSRLVVTGYAGNAVMRMGGTRTCARGGVAAFGPQAGRELWIDLTIRPHIPSILEGDPNTIDAGPPPVSPLPSPPALALAPAPAPSVPVLPSLPASLSASSPLSSLNVVLHACRPPEPPQRPARQREHGRRHGERRVDDRPPVPPARASLLFVCLPFNSRSACSGTLF